MAFNLSDLLLQEVFADLRPLPRLVAQDPHGLAPIADVHVGVIESLLGIGHFLLNLRCDELDALLFHVFLSEGHLNDEFLQRVLDVHPRFEGSALYVF